MVLQQWPKGAWSWVTYLAEDYGREMVLLVVFRAGLLYSEAMSYSIGNLSAVKTLASMSYS
jgi:hypothetical protein